MTMRPLIALMFLGTVVCAQAPAQPVATTQSSAASPAACPEMATALTTLLARDVRLRDWAEMARYREANKTLPAASGSEASSRRPTVATAAASAVRTVAGRLSPLTWSCERADQAEA